MNGSIKIGKKRIHSDWTLMQSYKEDEGTFLISFADKFSDDQVRLHLEEEDIRQLLKSLAGVYRKQPEILNEIIGK
jgi:hypothetical protein